MKVSKIDSLVLKIFLYGLPLAILLAIYCAGLDPQFKVSGPSWMAQLYDFGGLVFGLWMIFSLYICLRLIFSATFRETVLGKITFFQDKDEREVQLSGKATKGVFLSTLAILIGLLCLSVFRVSVVKFPAEQAVQGKHGTLTLGLEFSPLSPHVPEESKGLSNLQYSGLPFSNAGLILFLIVWQIAGYNWLMRRERLP